MPKIFRERAPGDDGHTIERCQRALAAAQSLAARAVSIGSTRVSEETVLEKYWAKQLALARDRREWRWGDDE